MVYIFAASEMEGQPVRRIAGPNDLVLITGGMGPRNAKSKAEATLGITSDPAANRKPDAVLIIGLCGGLSASVPEGRIVAYTDCKSTVDTNPPLPCSRAIANAVIALLATSKIQCDRVVGITSSRIATTREERTALASCGAAVVDMESYFILERAAAARVPAVVLRVVSDSINRRLPDFNRALDDGGAL